MYTYEFCISFKNIFCMYHSKIYIIKRKLSHTYVFTPLYKNYNETTLKDENFTIVSTIVKVEIFCHAKLVTILKSQTRYIYI